MGCRSMSRVVIDTFKDDTFYASIFMHVDRAQVVADARPSDAIALALSTGAHLCDGRSAGER